MTKGLFYFFLELFLSVLALHYPIIVHGQIRARSLRFAEHLSLHFIERPVEKREKKLAKITGQTALCELCPATIVHIRYSGNFSHSDGSAKSKRIRIVFVYGRPTCSTAIQNFMIAPDYKLVEDMAQSRLKRKMEKRCENHRRKFIPVLILFKKKNPLIIPCNKLSYIGESSSWLA